MGMWEVTIDCPKNGFPNVITSILKSGRGGQNQRDGIGKRTWPTIDDLDDGGKEAKSQESGQVLDAGERKEMESTLRPPEGNMALLTPCFQPTESVFRLLTSRNESC